MSSRLSQLAGTGNGYLVVEVLSGCLLLTKGEMKQLAGVLWSVGSALGGRRAQVEPLVLAARQGRRAQVEPLVLAARQGRRAQVEPLVLAARQGRRAQVEPLVLAALRGQAA
jgi:hypothetical protein